MKKLLLLLPFVMLLASFTVQNTSTPIPDDISALLNKHNCVTCHAMEKKLVGPSWKDVAAKKYTKKQIVNFVLKPEPANWPGYPPMAAQTTVPKADLNKIAAWLVSVK